MQACRAFRLMASRISLTTTQLYFTQEGHFSFQQKWYLNFKSQGHFVCHARLSDPGTAIYDVIMHLGSRKILSLVSTYLPVSEAEWANEDLCGLNLTISPVALQEKCTFLVSKTCVALHKDSTKYANISAHHFSRFHYQDLSSPAILQWEMVNVLRFIHHVLST